MKVELKSLDDFKEIVSLIRYKDWEIDVYRVGGKLYLQVSFIAMCPVEKEMKLQKGRKWYLSTHMTKSEVVTTAFKACLTAEEHECREHFTYKSAPIFCPHFNVDSLALIYNPSNLDKRN